MKRKCVFQPGDSCLVYSRIEILGESHGQRSLAGLGPWGGTELDTA